MKFLIFIIDMMVGSAVGILAAALGEAGKDDEDQNDGILHPIRAIEALQSAQPEKHTDKLTETHARDCISRQAAIDALIAEINEKPETYWDNGLNMYDVESVLKGLPSVQPEDKCGECDAWNQYKNYPRRSQWIPCKTVLPEKGQYVLCQCRAGIMDVLRLTDDNGWYKDNTHIYMHGFVLAWMPLPEPYRGEQE